MPLFECEMCGSIDNTALTHFWEALVHGCPRLCSACDPRIGQWHEQFERETLDQHLQRYPDAQVEFRARPRVVKRLKCK